MQIEAIHEIDLTPERDAEIAALLARTFGADDGYGGMSFYNQRHHLRLLARLDGELVGHYALGFRAMRMGAKRVQIIGIGEVATDPDHRGKGVATALMAATLDRARALRGASDLRRLRVCREGECRAPFGYRERP